MAEDNRHLAEPAVAYEAPAANGASLPRPSGKMRLGPQRRVVLPQPLADHLGVEANDLIIFILNEDGSATLKSGLAVAKSLQGALRHLSHGRSLVDELLAERRREVEEERANE